MVLLVMRVAWARWHSSVVEGLLVVLHGGNGEAERLMLPEYSHAPNMDF